jgi:ubiquitin carboxyl-terminal hydrolase 5/13
MSDISSVLPVIRGELSKLKIPGTHDKVYNDECMFSFDSPFSDTGLYVNMSTLFGYGADYYLADAVKSNCRLYVYEKWTQIPISDATSKQDMEMENPTKLAIGTSGGFITETKYDIIKENQIVIITDAGPQFFKLPNSELPEYVMNVADAIITHGGMKNKMSIDTWDSSNEIFISKYADALIQLECQKSISQDPASWKCEQSGDTENLWLNLSTGYIGGGRKNWDGTSLCMINTQT